MLNYSNHLLQKIKNPKLLLFVLEKLYSIVSEDVKPMNLVRTSSMKSEKMFEHASHSLPDTLFPNQNIKKSHGIISPSNELKNICQAIVFPEKPPLAPFKKVKT